MILGETGRQRLANQSIAVSGCRRPEEVVAVLGAMQAQDFTGALWSVGLRMPEATEANVEQAIADRKIVRTWLMRGTLHFVAAPDVRWMLDLLAPRTLARSVRRAAGLELDVRTFARCEKLFVRELAGNRQLTREALMELLERHKISTANQRGYHILWRLAQERLICFGRRVGKQHTFVLLDEWVPAARKPDRDAALAEMARRYFTSHGPATVQDFIGWTGLNAADARAGLDRAAARLARVTLGGTDYWMPRDPVKLPRTAPAGFLLPGFDEFLLGYKDRNAVLDPRHAQKVVPGDNGMFSPTVVLDGRVAGTWRRTLKKGAVTITVNPFKRLKKIEMRAITLAADRYLRFLGLPAPAASVEFAQLAPARTPAVFMP